MKKNLTALIILLCLVSGRSFAFSLESIDIRQGMILIGNADQSQGSAPSPLEAMLGIGFNLRFSPLISMKPALDFFGRDYLWTQSERAVPTNIETGTYTGDIAGVMGIILSIPFKFEFHPSESFSFGPAVGPSFLFRIPLIPLGDSDTGPMTNYFYSSLRFFYPEVNLFLNYDLSDAFAFGLTLRCLFPVFNMWSGETLSDGSPPPFWDQLLAGGYISVKIYL
jgi:hypothetical protein